LKYGGAVLTVSAPVSLTLKPGTRAAAVGLVRTASGLASWGRFLWSSARFSLGRSFAAPLLNQEPPILRNPQAPRPHRNEAKMSRNRAAVSPCDSLRRDRSNRTSAHANAATLSLTSTADSIRPVAACLTST
jgi:hypothetical protein